MASPGGADAADGAGEHRAHVGGAFVASLGIAAPRLVDGVAWTEVTIGPEHLNAGGIVHGGFVSALADWLTGVAVHARVDEHHYAPHTSLTVQFVRGARLGEQLDCSARCVSLGRRAASGEATFETGGVVVARALSSHVIVDRR